MIWIQGIFLFIGLIYTPKIIACIVMQEMLDLLPVILWALGWAVFIMGVIHGVQLESFREFFSKPY